MQNISRLIRLMALICALVVMSGCESSSERAERLYQSGLALAQAGNFTEALAEFGGALELDGKHKGAREAAADALFSLGKPEKAAEQYRALIEMYPDAFTARLKLAEIALAKYDTVEAGAQATEALRLEPSNDEAAAVLADVRYMTAAASNDSVSRAEAVAAAAAILGRDPSLLVARRVVIKSLVASDDPKAALPELDIALEQDPNSLELEEMKLSVLTKIGDDTGGLAQLKHMNEKFPDNVEIQQWLLDAYVEAGQIDAAIELLRGLARPGGDDPAPMLRLVDFIETHKGAASALDELKRLQMATAGSPLSDFFGLKVASREFEVGDKDAAISSMQRLLAQAETSDQTRGAKILLAGMLRDTGDVPAAAELVDQVLAEDGSNADALKMRAGWQLADGNFRDASLSLNRALEQNAADPELLTMLAQANEGLGLVALAGQNLSKAVELSQSGAEESLLLYRFLLRTGRPEVARSVLKNAVDANPDDVVLLSQMVEVNVAAGERASADQIIEHLRTIDSSDARTALQRAEQSAQRREERLRSLTDNLQVLAETSAGNDAASVSVLQVLVSSGKLTEGHTYLQGMLAKEPTNFDLRLLDAQFLLLEGDAEGADAILAGLMQDQTTPEQTVSGIAELLRQEGRGEEAAAMLAKRSSVAPGP